MIRPFEDAHIDALALSAEHRAVAITVLPLLRQLSAVGHAGTIVSRDGTVVGVYGAGCTDATKPEEVEVFLFLDPNAAQRYAGTLIKDLRHELGKARLRFKSVKANGPDAPLFFRWFQHLGFKPAGESARGGLAWV